MVILTNEPPVGAVPRHQMMSILHAIGYILVWLRIGSLAVMVMGVLVGIDELLMILMWAGGLDALNLSAPVGQSILIAWCMGTSFYMFTSGRTGLEFVRSERRRVLLIRRPGDTDVARTLSRAASRLGVKWRTVTVDHTRSGPRDAAASSARSRRAREPVRAHRICVHSAGEAEAARDRIYKQFWHYVLSPRSFIVHIDGADDELWRETAMAFGASCDAIVVDVSYIDDELIRVIKVLLRVKEPFACVFVVDRTSAESLFKDPTEDNLTLRLRELLVDRTVLVYDSHRNSRSRFVPVLRGGLELTMAKEDAWRGRLDRVPYSVFRGSLSI